MLKKLGRITKVTQDQEGFEVPGGQFVTEKFPVLTYGNTPRIDVKEWRFRVYGLVEQELVLTWEEFMAQPQTAMNRDFHCVTQWSKLNNLWVGVQFGEVLRQIKPKPEAQYIMVHCYGGYTTNLPLSVLMDDDVLLAYRHDGESLSAEHGGPVRLVVPKRYGWKSAKWVNGIELTEEDVPGFWETRGYHNEGDPVKEERFWSDLG